MTMTPAATASPAAPRAKKRRINYACNFCRSRKTRCDEVRPACTACQTAGVECVTTNLRNPSTSVVRHEAGRQGPASAATPAPAAVRRKRPAVGPPTASSPLSPAPLSPPPSHRPPRQTRPSQQLLRSAPVSPGRARSTLPVFQQARGSTYCEILSAWFDTPLYRLGIRSAWPLPTALTTTPLPSISFFGFGLCPLPGGDTVRKAADLFLAGPNTLFPVLDADAVEQLLDAAQACAGDPAELVRQAGYPALLLVYTIVIIGGVSLPIPQPPDLDVRGLLDSCASLMGHVLQETTTTTVRTMLLLALAQRCCNKAMASWNTMSLAVTTANTIGLSRPAAATPGGGSAKLWKSLCAFDRMLAFELGRSSSTSGYQKGESSGHPAPLLAAASQLPRAPGVEAAEAAESLALVLDDVARRCIDSTIRGQASEGVDLAATIHDKLATTGTAVLTLMDWAKSVPYALSPTVDLMQDQRYEAFESFLSLQYHNAIILLTRNGLLISEDALHHSIDETATGAPWEAVIRSGQSIAANAARKILRLITRSATSGIPSILPCVVAPLHAIIALSIHVLTGTSREPAADDALLRSAAAALQETSAVRGGDATAVQSLLTNLETMRLAAMQEATPFGPQDSPATGEGPSADASVRLGTMADSGITEAPGQDATTMGGFWQELHDCEPVWPDQIGWDWSNFTEHFP
ncbi:hypothetical protein F5X68DRAFT_231851 [Plectosphaerella plurivora]|uniref:Zn(2)-C6 fungal-type domain-containing protein n=1 Tax=Plectosphaerella plurivora TaxID=936078 RepID=A0A9P8VDS3_9PEZI|nr:hypothetical protein F5X68DRAFT_231851 [Plectosphaerella plurivora]